MKKAKRFTISIYDCEKDELCKKKLLMSDEQNLFYYLTKDAYGGDIGFSKDNETPFMAV